MSKNEKELIKWSAPYTENDLISFQPPIFKEYEKLFDKEDINLIEKLHNTILKKETDCIDPSLHFRYNYDLISFLIEDQECGPAIEFYFNGRVPIFHAVTFDLWTNSYREYRKSRKHYLLTITEELLNNYKINNDVFEFIFIHNDPQKIYQLKFNQSEFYCEWRKIEFLSINEFFEVIHKNFDRNRLKSHVEKFAFIDA